MLELALLLVGNLDRWILAFFRVGAMLAWAPALGHRSIPVAHRVGLATLLAVIVLPAVKSDLGPGAQGPVPWVLAIAGEVLIGLAIAFVARVVIGAVEVAGEMIGLEMGFSIATVFDPSLGVQETIVSRFLQQLALVAFLTANGHHLLIRAVGGSFQRIALGSAIDPAQAGGLAALGGKLIQSGCSLAAPVVAVLLVVNVGLALMGRIAPQTNIFVVGLPLGIGLGLFALAETLPGFVQGVGRLVAEIPADIDTLVIGARHGLR